MKKLIHILLFVFFMIFSSSHNLQAQTNSNTTASFVTAAINSDAFTGLEFGYLHGSNIADNSILYYARINIPIFLSLKQKRLDTWEIKFGAEATVVDNDKFLLLSDLNVFILRHKQILGTFLPIGFNIKITPAYKMKNGYLGFQAIFNQVCATYINHSDYIKDTFNDITTSTNQLYSTEPQNGFYDLTGNSLNLGLESKFKINDSLEMYFDLGMTNYLSKYTSLFDAMMFGQIPFYLDIRMDYMLSQNK